MRGALYGRMITELNVILCILPSSLNIKITKRKDIGLKCPTLILILSYFILVFPQLPEIYLLMTGFEPHTSNLGRDCSPNGATTTAQIISNNILTQKTVKSIGIRTRIVRVARKHSDH